MTVGLHQPFKAARQLNLSWRVCVSIVLVVAWMWARQKVYEKKHRVQVVFDPTNRFSICFKNGEKGVFGYHDWNGWRHELVPVTGSFSEMKDLLRGARASFDTCAGKTFILACGCEHIFPWLTQDIPFEENDMRCEDCGKYHKAARGKGKDVYRDCPTHSQFFRRWPDVNRGYYYNGDCPQIRGIDPCDAYSLMKERLEQDSLDIEHQTELVMAAAKEELWAIGVVKIKGVDPDLCDQLCSSIRKTCHAREILEDYRSARLDLGPKAVLHLERVITFWSSLLWLVRVSTIVAVALVWYWHFPEWKTSLTLAITVIGVWIFRRLAIWFC